MLLRLSGKGSLHGQVYAAVREAVHGERLKPGERIPSSRAMALELGLSRTVVLQAYDRLHAEGYVDIRPQSGTFISGAIETALLDPAARSGTEALSAPPRTLSKWGSRLANHGFPRPREPGNSRFVFNDCEPDSSSFPHSQWRRIIARTVGRVPSTRADPQGSQRLREAIAAYLARARGIRCSSDQILIVSGSQQGLQLAAQILLDVGGKVALEDPHYPGARAVLEASGAKLQYIPVDDDGIQTDRLWKSPRDVRMVVVTPSHQFPRGGVLPLARRLALIDWARRSHAMVLEDDYDSEYRYDTKPVEAIQALAPEQVIYVGTFSKVLSPALRLGYLVLPEDLVEVFRTAKWLSDRYSPLLEQEALAEFIEGGHFERHIRRSRRRYSRRRGVLLEALAESFGNRVVVGGADAGLHLAITLPHMKPKLEPQVIEEASLRGVAVQGLSKYYAGKQPTAGLLLGYAVISEEAIPAALKRLRAAVDAVERRTKVGESPLSLVA